MTDQNNNDPVLKDDPELDPSDGQPYIDELQAKLFNFLAPAQSIEAVGEHLRKHYPGSKLVDLAIQDANKQRQDNYKNHKIRHHSASSSSASFTEALHKIQSFAIAKVSNLVRDGIGEKKADNELYKYKLALIQFITADVENLAKEFVRRQKIFLVTRSDIRTAMHADKDLMDMFLSDDQTSLITQNHPILTQINCSSEKILNGHRNITYNEKVRSMVDSENSFIRGLKLIIKVFKAQLEKLPCIQREVQIIFCNIDELLGLSTQLLTILEEALESVGREDEVPFVGSEIFDLAQAEEFHAYFNFAYMRLYRGGKDKMSNWRHAYLTIIRNESTMKSISTAGQSFDLAVKHLLPNYLLNTITHFFEYFNNISELSELSRQLNNPEDVCSLEETISILNMTKRAIESLVENELDQDEIEPLEEKQAENIRSILERELDVELRHERNLPLPYMPPPEIYRFSEPDSEENIIFEDFESRTINQKDLDKHLRNDPDQIPVIRCATLTKLVERLTYHKYQPNIVDSFLTTYRSFISDPEELLDLLIERFNIPDIPVQVVYPNFEGREEDLPERDRIEFKQYKKRFRQEYSKPVKMRVINVFKSWIKNHFYDFERHPKLLEKLNHFLDEVYKNDKVLRNLIVSIKKSIEQKKIKQRDEIEFMLSKEPPSIQWGTAKPNEPEKFDILTLHPEEFARQLTLIQFDLFRAIKPQELIDVKSKLPNKKRYTRHFELFCYWIIKCIIEADDTKRFSIYKQAIEIMGYLRELNNFTGLLSIGSALNKPAVIKLKLTKDKLSRELRKIMDDHNELVRDHQKKLQKELKNCNPPCIPYVGDYQTKLNQAQEGNRTFMDEMATLTISPTLSNDEFHSSFSNSPATPISPRSTLPASYRTRNNSNSTPLSATSTVQNQFFGGAGSVQPLPKMINFTKQRISAGLVAEISNYQNTPYCLKVQPEIRKYIESIDATMLGFAIKLKPGVKESDLPEITNLLDQYLYDQSKILCKQEEAKNKKLRTNATTEHQLEPLKRLDIVRHHRETPFKLALNDGD